MVLVGGAAAFAGTQLGIWATFAWSAQLLLCWVVGLAGQPWVTLTTVVAGPLGAGLAAGWAAARRRRAEERARAQEAAAALERARLAREMHDSLAKTLDALALGAAALPLTLAEPTRASQLAQTLREGTLDAARDARELLSELRSGTLTLPLADAVRTIADEWGRRGWRVEVDAQDVAAPPTIRYELCWILREAMRNVEATRRRAPSTSDCAATDGCCGSPSKMTAPASTSPPTCTPAPGRPSRPGRHDRARPGERRHAGGPPPAGRRHGGGRGRARGAAERGAGRARHPSARALPRRRRGRRLPAGRGRHGGRARAHPGQGPDTAAGPAATATLPAPSGAAATAGSATSGRPSSSPGTRPPRTTGAPAGRSARGPR
ncbi:histidine kinase [Luedemannella flava]